MNVGLNELPVFVEGVLKKIEPKSDTAFLIFLSGQLGSGKTTFMQAFARALGVADTVQSPTFVLMKKYPLLKEISRGPSLTPGLSKDGPREIPPRKENQGRTLESEGVKVRPWFSSLIHIDAYRLEDPKEFAALRPEEFLHDPQNLVCIEWAENVAGVLPEPDLILKFSSEGMEEGERKIRIQE